MLDYSVLNTSSAVHALVVKIEHQYSSLRSLIDFNQNCFEKKASSMNMFKEEKLRSCIDYSEGNSNEEETIHSWFNHENELLYYLENDFYHATFIMTYSYFESIVTAICKEIGINQKNNVIGNVEGILLHCNGSQFPPEIKSKYDYVVGDLKKVRNLLTHNYNGTDKKEQLEAAERESQRGIGFHKITDEIFHIEPTYVRMMLDNAYDILNELTKILKFQ